MSQTAIPLEFERYLQNQISVGDEPDMNEMIFAHIPGLDPSQPINRENGLPDVSLWVHQQDIDQVGKLGDNALAYSVVIPGTVAEFTFNAIYLRDKNVPSSCGMVVHKAEETKENGMASTKSLVQAYDGAAQIAGITVDASTWQIDYQARLKGIEEDHRLACLDNYGHTAFVDGFDVTQQADPNKYKVTPGVVYVGGLRGVLAQEVIQTVATKPNGLYVDVVRQGTALSVWENKVTIAVSETELTDYVDGNGDQHYVAKLAGINADGSVVDWRVKGGLALAELKSNAATDVDIDEELVKEKHVKLPQFWRALTPSRLVEKMWLGMAAKIFPVGAAIPWFTDVAPDGFAIMKNQAFDMVANPELAKVFTDGIIPDMRGCGVIGKSDGETVGAYEEGQVKEHGHDGSTVSSTNLGSKNTSTDTHGHSYAAKNQSKSVTADGTNNTNVASNIGGTLNTDNDSHYHSVSIGSHAHSVVIALFGALKNTIDHRKVNWIVRMA